MTTTISTAALANAAHALATAMPSSTLPIGPQLEAWVLLTLGGAFKKLGASVQAAPIGPFYIRLNQHKAFKGPQSSWLEITYQGRSYELHNALQIAGLSGAHHEIDVCLISGNPTTAPVSFDAFRAGIECKQHAAAVSENVVRALLGVSLEVSWLVAWPFHPWGVVSTHATVSANTGQLLGFYNIAFVGIDPTTVTHHHPDIDAFALRALAWI